MKCPKCNSECPLVREYREDAEKYPRYDSSGEVHFPTIEDIIASTPVPPLHGHRFDKLFACPTHGEFGTRPDGSFEFEDPDTYVLGPNGEKLFRI